MTGREPFKELPLNLLTGYLANVIFLSLFGIAYSEILFYCAKKVLV